MSCKNYAKSPTRKDSFDYPLATVKKALAIRELSERLHLSPEFVVDNLDLLSEILTWKPKIRLDVGQ